MGDDDRIIIHVHRPGYCRPPWWFAFADLRALDHALEARYGTAMRRLAPPADDSP